MNDPLLPGSNFAIQLPVFEGPLDLLLYLIRRSEIDIYDIPIEQVTRQYIEIINSMKTVDLEVAGEFFVMASTLMYIKSRMLLPKPDRDAAQREDEYETTDPRWELVQQLLEYKKFKEVATQIEALILNKDNLMTRRLPQTIHKAIERTLYPIEHTDLWHTFNHVLRRLSERIVDGEIQVEQVTLANRIEFIRLHLKKKSDLLFSELFESTTTLNTVVATFLAILELTRLGEVDIYQDTAFSDIHCKRSE